MRSARMALALLSAGVAFTVLATEAEAKDRYCRKEYCANAPNRCTGGFMGIQCTPRVGACLQTGVKVVRC